jgi:hypothetical protein
MAMAEAQKTGVRQFRHWISFAHGGEPFALVLPDRRLYDAYASWLRGEGKPGFSFPREGQEMSINFAHVQRMELEEVADATAGESSRGSNPVPLTEPPPIE